MLADQTDINLFFVVAQHIPLDVTIKQQNMFCTLALGRFRLTEHKTSTQLRVVHSVVAHSFKFEIIY
jgi:hypothetical protein